MGTKVEVVMRKAEARSWAALEVRPPKTEKNNNSKDDSDEGSDEWRDVLCVKCLHEWS